MATYTVTLRGGRNQTVEADSFKSSDGTIIFVRHGSFGWEGPSVAMFPAQSVLSVVREPDPQPDPLVELTKRVEATNHILISVQDQLREQRRRRRWFG